MEQSFFTTANISAERYGSWLSFEHRKGSKPQREDKRPQGSAEMSPETFV